MALTAFNLWLATATAARGDAVADDEDEDEAACAFVMYTLQIASSVIMYLSFTAHMVDAAA